MNEKDDGIFLFSNKRKEKKTIEKKKM